MVRLLLFIFLVLPFAACVKSAGEGEEIAGQPVPISGKTIIDPTKITLEQTSETEYEVVAQEGAMQGPDRCVTGYLATLADYEAFRTDNVLPASSLQIEIGQALSRTRVRRALASRAIVLVPSTCGVDGHTQDQLSAAVYFDFDDTGAHAIPFADARELLSDQH